MKGSGHIRDLAIGFVFLGAIGFVGVITLAISDVPLLRDTTEVDVPFARVNGVRVGDDIRLSGFSVGTVADVKRRPGDPDYGVLVTLRFREQVELPPDTTFNVESLGPLGGRYISIEPGEAPPVPLEEGAGQFQGTANGDLFEQLATVVQEVRRGNGLLGQLIRNETVGQDFATIVAEFREIIQAVRAGEGVLGALIMGTDLRQRFEDIVAGVDDAVADINQGEGVLGMLFNDQDVRDSARNVIANLEEISQTIRQGEGTIGRLINDPAIYDDLQVIVARVGRATEGLEEGRGALGLLLGDEEFAANLDALVESLRESAERISRGEGTIGELVNNRELYEELNRLVISLENAVEDFREQAPISTFINAIFSVF